MRKRIKKLFIACVPYRIKLLLYSWFAHDLGMDNDMYRCIDRLKNLGLNPDCIIDIGAYNGDWTNKVINIFNQSTILMVEPQKSKEALLKKIVKKNKNILYAKKLLGAERKENVQFFEMESGSSIYEEQTNHPRTAIYYNMSTLDELIKEYNLNGKFFLKLDVQGAELDVLDGASENINYFEALLLEVSLLNFNLGGPQFAEVIIYLQSRNFVLFDICNQYRRSDKILFQVDLMFINKDSLIRKNIEF